MRHPLGAIAVDTVLFPLNKPDKIRLFHPKWVNSHPFRHPLNLLKSHFTLLYVMFLVGWNILKSAPLHQIGEISPYIEDPASAGGHWLSFWSWKLRHRQFLCMGQTALSRFLLRWTDYESPSTIYSPYWRLNHNMSWLSSKKIATLGENQYEIAEPVPSPARNLIRHYKFTENC